MACGQDKIASASIQTYDVMVPCLNSKELCPNLFRRHKGFTARTKYETAIRLLSVVAKMSDCDPIAIPSS